MSGFELLTYLSALGVVVLAWDALPKEKRLPMTVAAVSLLVVLAGVLAGIWEVVATRRERERERLAQRQPKHALQYPVRRRLTIQGLDPASPPVRFAVGSAGRAA